jgi:hypothetical protein
MQEKVFVIRGPEKALVDSRRIIVRLAALTRKWMKPWAARPNGF